MSLTKYLIAAGFSLAALTTQAKEPVDPTRLQAGLGFDAATYAIVLEASHNLGILRHCTGDAAKKAVPEYKRQITEFIKDNTELFKAREHLEAEVEEQSSKVSKKEASKKKCAELIKLVNTP